MLSALRPKYIMIFGVICMIIGLGFFGLWNHVHAPRLIRHWNIVEWATRTLGRYGISALYFFGGMVVFLKGYAALRSEERSRNIR